MDATETFIEAARRVATWNARDMLDYGYSHYIEMDEPYQDADTEELAAIDDKNRARVIVHLRVAVDRDCQERLNTPPPPPYQVGAGFAARGRTVPGGTGESPQGQKVK